MKKKKAKSISQKAVIKTTLSLLSLFILLCSAWIHESAPPVAPSNGESAKLFSNQTGDNLELAYTSAIRKAKDSVILMIFSMTHPSVLQALREKSEEGVYVKVICDAKSCPNIIQKLGPKVDVVRRFGKGLMHLKILAIDGQECWVGSSNLTSESLLMHSNLVVAFQDPSFTATMVNKALSLKEYDKELEFSHQTFAIGGQMIGLSFLPDDKEGSLRIKELIRSAKKTIRIAMFTWTRYDMAKELIRAQKKGVQVEVVLDRNQAKGTSSKIAELLKKEGIKTQLSTGTGLLHHKFMWIDDHVLEIGSANWTKAAFTQNDDCFLVIQPLTAEQNAHLEKLWIAIKQNSK